MSIASCAPRDLEPDGPFDAAVFAGGGCRSFWQGGFWTEAAPALGLAPRVIGAVSAGSAIACGVVTGLVEQVLENFKRCAAANPRNVYPRNLLSGRPIFPHEAIYRRILREPVDDAVMERLRAGPEIRVLVGRPPAWAGSALSLFLAVLGEGAEQLRGEVHARYGRRLGFRPEVIPVSACRDADEVVELILHSSCTPPALPWYRRDGRRVLDGGIIDAVPVETVADAKRVLVLLTRPWAAERLPRVPGRLYVGPSEPVPISAWDYTNPKGLQATFDLGRRDGERFARAAQRAG